MWIVGMIVCKIREVKNGGGIKEGSVGGNGRNVTATGFEPTAT